MSEKVIVGSVHIENYGQHLARMYFWGSLDLLTFINREDAKKIAEVMERFARTGRVEDKKDE